MIAASEEVGYIHEPFNINRGPGICRTRFPLWFTYVRPGTEGELLDDFRRLLAFRYNYRAQAASIGSRDDLKALIRDGAQFARFRMRKVRPLLKDPIALFSSEWIAESFDAQVVVIARHPAAVASSIKRLGWTHPFSHFVDQPSLIDDHLSSFRDEIDAFARDDRDILDQAALLWRLIHSTIAGYRERHPDWIFVRHEDLSRDPIEGFRAIFEALELDYPEAVQETIRRSTSSSNPADRVPGDRMFGVRNSRANVDNWKRRLTPTEIERIRSQVQDVSPRFYTDDEW